jgi:hypothetical protein
MVPVGYDAEHGCAADLQHRPSGIVQRRRALDDDLEYRTREAASLASAPT